MGSEPNTSTSFSALYEPSEEETQVLLELLHNVPILLQGRMPVWQAKSLLAFLEDRLPAKMRFARECVADRG